MSLSLKTALSYTGSELFENSPLPSWVVNAKSLAIVASNLAARSGYKTVEGQKIFLQLLDEYYRILLMERVSRCSKIEEVNDLYVLLDKNGNKVFADLYASSFDLGGQSCIQFTAIPHRNHHAPGDLKEEHHRYKSYMENSTDGIYCMEYRKPAPVDLEFDELVLFSRQYTYISYSNQAMARMYGFDNSTDLRNFLEPQVLDFEDPLNISFLEAFVANGYHIINAPSHEKDRNGNTRYFLNTLVGVIENGHLKRIWGTQKDITEKKITEEKLQLLASLVEQTSDVLTASDIDFKPITWNKAAETVYGISGDEVIGRDLSDYITFNYTGYSREEVRAILREKGEWRGEASFVRPSDKKYVTVMFGFKTRLDEQNMPIGYLISASDITERKFAESRLKESESRFREMADSSPVMIWMSNESSITSYTNRKWIEFTGVDITGDPLGWSKLVHPDDLETAKAVYMDAFKRMDEVTMQYRLWNKDGSYRWVHDVSVPRFTNDQFIGYIGSVVDIEDQKQTENQLRYNATILDNVSDIIVTTDLEYKVKSWNPSAEHYYGIPAAQAMGERMSEMMQFQFTDISLATILKDLNEKGEWKGSLSYVNRKGEERHFLHTVKGIYNEAKQKIGYLAAARDVTERVVAEKKLEKSENFYRTLIADSSNAMLLLDESGMISFASPSVKKVLGYEVADIVGKNSFEFVHTEDLLWAAQSFQQEVKENPVVKSIVVRLLKKDGEWLWCMIRGHNMLNNPSVNSIVIYFHDDTLRKQANEALKESEKRFRNLIRELQIGVFLTDGEGSILLCNQSFAALLSATDEELIGQNIYDFMIEGIIDEKGEAISRQDSLLEKLLETRKPVNNYVMGVLHPETGERIWLMINSDPILDENGQVKHVVHSVTNITERKKLEQKLISEKIDHQRQLTQATLDGQEAERREIGKELHDNIGQQLTTIKLFLDLANSTADDNTQEMVNLALKGVGDVINEVRAMSRALVPSTLQDLGLIESINELVDSISRTQVLRISFDHDNFDEQLMPDNQQLTVFRIVQEQLNNIVKHAGAGNVNIRLSRKLHELVLDIRDDGKGFDPKKLKKGLGFINISNRAELFGGKKHVVSSPGKGCFLKVRFPLSHSSLPSSLT